MGDWCAAAQPKHREPSVLDFDDWEDGFGWKNDRARSGQGFAFAT
jgi:hypothetical protein